MPAILILLLPGEAAARYNVSGVVEFSYRNYETEIGSDKISDNYFTQTYRANIGSFLWDPRFAVFNGGIGYNLISNGNGSDSRNLSYNLSTSFFPGMKISWDLFGTKDTNRVESNINIAGYETTTTSYGGTLRLNLNTGGRRGNNNNRYYNRYNNFNNNRGWSRIPLPDITLSRVHHESESLNTVNPLNETRDDTKASIQYRRNSRFTLVIDGGLEEYRNMKDNSSYDTSTASLSSDIQVSRDAELKLNGRLTDRTTTNIAGYDASRTSSNYSVALNFEEKEGVASFYRYDFSRSQIPGNDFESQRVQAQISYRFDEDLNFNTGVNYGVSDYTTTTAGGQEVKSTLETGGIQAGAAYHKLYTPGFLGPFGFNTDYGLNAGFSKLSGNAIAQEEGSGWYYANSVGLGLRSIGWKEETASLTYSYSNKRDQSPLNNDMELQSCSLSISTRRVPRTSINASGSYAVQHTRLENTNNLFMAQLDSNAQRRTMQYNVNAVYTASSYLRLQAGASRGDTTSVTSYSLSTLPSVIISQDDLFYGAAQFSYRFTRNVLFNAELREEYRSTKTTDTKAHQLNMNLNYRIRAIFINFEYRWRQDDPDNALKSTQQYYFAKLSRPF